MPPALKPAPHRPKLYDTREAADMLGVPLSSVRTAVASGQLRGLRVGRKFFVRKDDVDRLRQRVVGDERT